MPRYLMSYTLKGCIEIDAPNKSEAVDNFYDESPRDLGSRCDDAEITNVEETENE